MSRYLIKSNLEEEGFILDLGLSVHHRTGVRQPATQSGSRERVREREGGRKEVYSILPSLPFLFSLDLPPTDAASFI